MHKLKAGIAYLPITYMADNVSLYKFKCPDVDVNPY
jgi:hypothetical protein